MLCSIYFWSYIYVLCSYFQNIFDSALLFKYGLPVMSFTLSNLKTKNETTVAALIDLLTIFRGGGGES